MKKKTELKLKKIDKKPKVFSIKTYEMWDILEDSKNHKRMLCINLSTREEFQFSIDIDRTSLRPEFSCVYVDDNGQSVLIYRAEPNNHVKKFWNDLLDEWWRRNHGYKDNLRDKVLKKWNFNWEKED